MAAQRTARLPCLASNGSPTAPSPTVVLEDRALPLVTPVSNAVDRFELWTGDGATWVGKQRQNVGKLTLPTVANLSFQYATRGTSRTINPGATPIGDSIFVFIANTSPSSGATPTVTDTKSNMWTLDATAGSAGSVIWIARATLTTALTGSDTISVAFASTDFYAYFAHVTGLGTTPVLEPTRYRRQWHHQCCVDLAQRHVTHDRRQRGGL
jgi:hypothetical protein